MKAEKVPAKFSRLNCAYDIYSKNPSDENLGALLIEVEAAARKILRVKHDAHAFLMDSVDFTKSNDLSQQVMTRVWQNLSKFHQESSFSSWVYRICQNAKIDAIRQANRRLEVPLKSDTDEQHDDSEECQGIGGQLTSEGVFDLNRLYQKQDDDPEEFDERLDEVSKSLPAQQAKVLNMYRKGSKAREIGKAFGRNSNWASKQLGLIKDALAA